MFYGLCVIWCRLRILIGDEIGELKQSPSKLEMWLAWLLVWPLLGKRSQLLDSW